MTLRDRRHTHGEPNATIAVLDIEVFSARRARMFRLTGLGRHPGEWQAAPAPRPVSYRVSSFNQVFWSRLRCRFPSCPKDA